MLITTKTVRCCHPIGNNAYRSCLKVIGIYKFINDRSDKLGCYSKQASEREEATCTPKPEPIDVNDPPTPANAT